MSNANWKREILLSDLTTLGIGGPTDFYMEVSSIEQCRSVLEECKNNNLPFFILGKGSNCLFSDEGFRGLLLHIKIDHYHPLSNGKYKVGAGFSFSLLGTRTSKEGFSGLEFAAGIPASVGGAVFMNAGANGQETADTLVDVEFLHTDGTIERFSREQLTFSYRTSPFQKMKGVILSATFQLTPSTEARKRQHDLLQYRMKTQPYHEKSAGCIYRNPTGGSAGMLIEKMGLKGVTIGGAAVSEMHGNFLVNRNNASFADMQQLMEFLEKESLQKSGVALTREIRMIMPNGELYEK